ncbi:INO80 complex subunit E [Lingula anatina]|uniref:INO80 complex subunit E n=1 Tax=Lingula anatina TaxID=7574 RepID=A0A1S3IPB6_LINAN|nr:INO80 complex subunit E [Lingula anatina]|eukprot:XP_013399918.1 INO80 complex subunit E [Lingula anatina]
MMPVAQDGQDPNSTPEVDYKQKYRVLKRKLKYLIFEQECFTEELRKAQRKLLKVSRDKSFLLDRLLQYEKLEDSSSESEVVSTDDEGGGKEGSSKKKKSNSSLGTEASAMLSGMASLSGIVPQTSLMASSSYSEPPKKKAKTAKKVARPAQTGKGSKPRQTQAQKDSTAAKKDDQNLSGSMSREEIERHLDSRPAKPSFMVIEKPSLNMPLDIFSNENSNPDSESMDTENSRDLVIDTNP